MIRAGLKQSFKKPISALLFLILMIITVAFLSLGVYIFMSTQDTLSRVEEVYRTVGTIQQKPIGSYQKRGFDTITQTITYSPVLEYGEPVSLESFNFNGINYIHPPENRAHYFATSSKYKRGYWESNPESYINTIEFKIMEVYPNVAPVRAEVTRVLGGSYKIGQEVWVSQHMLEKPTKLEPGKTYVATVHTDGSSANFDDYHKISQYTILEPVSPANIIVSSQIDITGKSLDNPEFADLENCIFEVTDEFYESDIGKRLLHSKNTGTLLGNANITTTNSLKLMMPFYNNEVIIESGREITKEEFDTGTAVCLIGSDQAVNNNLNVGDIIDFDFYNVRYGSCMGNNTVQIHSWAFDLFNANGEMYNTFYSGEYEIVGIYKTYGDGTRDPFNLGYSTVIIPSKSIKASDENNRSGNLILQAYNVSFEIPNGTTGAYLEKVKEAGLDELVDITFYDGGYENIKAGLQDLFQMSIVLMAIGVITTLAVLLFFSFLFIGKQKKRIAIERSLGVPKIKCAISLIISVFIVAVIGTAIGSVAGTLGGELITQNVEMISQQEERSTKFSSWVNEGQEITEYEDEHFKIDNIVVILEFLSVIAISIIIPLIYAQINLRKEPMTLLSQRDK